MGRNIVAYDTEGRWAAQRTTQGPGQGQPIGGGVPGRRRQEGGLVVDVIRKNSLASGYGPSANAGGLPA